MFGGSSNLDVQRHLHVVLAVRLAAPFARRNTTAHLSPKSIVAAAAVTAADANVLDAVDMNYISEVLQLDLEGGPTDPTDHIAARKWLETKYRSLPKRR
ncbi:MAG: hypothetical protein STHCBS139747_003213 [Sporothrix thermara]